MITDRFPSEEASQSDASGPDHPAAVQPAAVVTVILVALNILVFVTMVFGGGVSPISPKPDDLIRWGSGFGPLETNGQWWRLCSAMFIHIGIAHLGMNMFVLWSSGRFMERLFGSTSYAVLYLLSGLAGGVASVLWHPMQAAAGASGAIFGLYGGLFGFLVMRGNVIAPEARAALVRTGLGFVIANTAYGFLQNGIDVAAHLGGLLAGVPLGAVLAPGLGRSSAPVRKAFPITVTVVATGVVALAAATRFVPIIDDWPAAVRRVAALEAKGQTLLSESLRKVSEKQMTWATFASTVESQLLRPWDAERRILLALRVPKADRNRVQSMAQYMALEEEYWRLTAEAAEKNDAQLLQRSVSKRGEALKMLAAAGTGITIPQDLTAAQADAEAEAAFQVEFQKFRTADSTAAQTYNAELGRLKAGKLSATAFAAVIEQKVVTPLTSESDRFEDVVVPAARVTLARQLLHYVRLRRDGYKLRAAAIRANDSALLEQAKSKDIEAAEALKYLGTKPPAKASK